MKGKILLNRIFVLQIKIFFKYFAFFPFYLLYFRSYISCLFIYLILKPLMYAVEEKVENGSRAFLST